MATQQTSNDTTYYFSRAGQHPDQELIKVIDVRVISDKQESNTKAQATELIFMSFYLKNITFKEYI